MDDNANKLIPQEIKFKPTAMTECIDGSTTSTSLEERSSIRNDQASSRIKEENIIRDTVGLGSTRAADVYEDLRSFQCFVCSRKVYSPRGHSRSPIDQLNELLEVLRVSVASFDHIRATEQDLPSLRLYCSTCNEQLMEAVDIISRIKSLQYDLKVVTNILRQNLVRNRSLEVADENGWEWLGKIRKALKQCFSSCEVAIQPNASIMTELNKRDILSDSSTRISQHPLRKENIDAVERNQHMTEEKPNEDNDIKTADADFTPSNSCEELDSDYDENVASIEEVTIVAETNTGEGDRSLQGINSKVETPNKQRKANSLKKDKHHITKLNHGYNTANRTHKDGSVVALNCPHCKQTFTPDIFRTESGEYIFRCTPDCCGKTMKRFIHIVRHHESFCPSMPKELYSSKRKRKATQINRDERISKDPLQKVNNTEMKRIQRIAKDNTNEDNSSKTVNKDFIPSISDVELDSDDDENAASLEEVTIVGETSAGVSDRWLQGISSKVKAPNKQRKANSLNTDKPRRKKLNQGYNPANRTYKDGNVVALNCPHCKQTFTPDNFRTESGEYIFRCTPDCCGKTMKRFIHIVRHHESFCPSMPKELYSRKRERQAYRINTDESQRPTLVVLNNQELTYNESHDLVAFNCRNCEEKFLVQDFQSDAQGEFVFKCRNESCEVVRSHFYALCVHHKSHCTGVAPKKKRRNRPANYTDGNVEDHQERQENNGRVYNISGRLISFVCCTCEKQLSYSDFLHADTGKYVFKCSPNCCDKVFSLFNNLVSHHEAQCRRQGKVGPSVGTKNTITSSGESSTNKIIPGPEEAFLQHESFKCKHCQENFKKSFHKDPSEKAIYLCGLPNCGKTFSSFSTFQNHHESTCPKRSKEAFVCNICNKVLKSPTYLRTHMISFHTHKYPFYCEKCGVGCVSKASLYIHTKTHGEERKYKCQTCSASYKKKEHLQKHVQRSHKNDLSFICDECGKGFKVMQGLKWHKQTVHSINGPANCPICNKTFGCVSYMRYHVKYYHNKRTDQAARKRLEEIKDVENNPRIVEAESSGKNKRKGSPVKLINKIIRRRACAKTTGLRTKKTKISSPSKYVVVDGIFTDNMD